VVSNERRRPLPAGSYAVGKAEQFRPGTLTAVETSAGPVVVAHTDDGFRALHPTCPHTGGPLVLGKLDGGCVACPWHAARFELATGRACGGPSKVPLPVYPAAVVDGELVVSVNEGP
jgi:nitrite reductase/ring-hydroxylating ferredoxin subunit